MEKNRLDLIREYCTVIDEVTEPFTAIFYKEDGFGYVDTDVVDEGEFLSFSCNNRKEFTEICEMIKRDFF